VLPIASKEAFMNIESPGIPYNFSDLEPAISRDTLVLHFGRHQRVCYDRVLAGVRGTQLEALSLEELIRVTERNPAQHNVYRCAAELWNHNLYWRSMRPGGGGAPHGVVADYVRARFGSYERFAREFRETAAAHFGSGWLFVVVRDGTLRIVTTSNAGTPLVRGDHALLALDLWEHAYYLDHENRRGAYVSAFLEELVDWDGANARLAQFAGEPRALRKRSDAASARAGALRVP
jgi:Fe-Mn family superoxide dismutase